MSQSYAWTQVAAEAAFQPREGAGALSFADAMWLIGGWNPQHAEFPNICVNDVWHSANGQDWTCAKQNAFGLPSFETMLRMGKAVTQPAMPSTMTGCRSSEETRIRALPERCLVHHRWSILDVCNP